MCIEEQRIKQIEDLLLDCTELRDLFHPTEDYPTYESMVDASIDWAFDNHNDEVWSLELSAIGELVYYKYAELLHIPVEKLHPIYTKIVGENAP